MEILNENEEEIHFAEDVSAYPLPDLGGINLARLRGLSRATSAPAHDRRGRACVTAGAHRSHRAAGAVDPGPAPRRQPPAA
ncbi:MAG: hypothetical protein WKF78_03320 [Candidatus Limnocylindrales bacterium]